MTASAATADDLTIAGVEPFSACDWPGARGSMIEALWQ